MRTLLTALLAISLGAGLGAAPKKDPAGVITAVSGKVTLFTHVDGADKNAEAADGTALELGQTLYLRDRIKTGANGRVSLALLDGTQLKVNYNSDITLRAKDSKGHTSDRGVAAIGVLLGDLWAKVTKKNSELEFDTPAAVAAVKGTEPLINVGPDGTLCLKLRSGEMALSNEFGGGVNLDPNQMICIPKHKKIDPSMIQPWKASGEDWDKSFTLATSAQVKITYLNDAGGLETLILNYADGGVSGTAK